MRLAAFLAGLAVGAWLVLRQLTGPDDRAVHDFWVDLYRMPNYEPQPDEVGGWQ